MLKNYFTTAFRNIFRNSQTSFINIAGLGLAMACCMLIYLYISDEVSYDQHHSKSDRIYRITRDFISQDGITNLRLANVAPPIGPLIKADFGEVEVMARTINFGLVIGLEENGQLNKNFSENDLYLAEPDLFKIFDIEMIGGEIPAALERPFTIMLSERTAKKFFAEGENPVGKRLRADSQFDLEVTGVFKDFPRQSHFHPDYLVSFSTLENDNIYGRRALETNWGNNAFGTYVLLSEGTDPVQLENKLPEFINKHFGTYAIANFGAPADFDASKSTKLHVQKVTDIHLHSDHADELEVNGNINNVYMMGVIALFIILIACFNFINLSTARATKRAKEVGLRKVVGADRSQLIFQYLSESIVTTFLSLFLALGIVQITIGWLNDFTNKTLTLNLLDSTLLMGIFTGTFLIGILAGIYPAFILSGFKPVLTLKGKGASQGKGVVRKVLVVAQFSISIVLIIATVVTLQQLNFLNERNLGYDKDQIITLPNYSELDNHYETFRDQVLRSSAIKNMGRSSRVPTGRLLDSSGSASVLQGDSLVSTQVNLKMVAIDHDFFETYGIEMEAGRAFSRESVTDDSLSFIINETAAKEIGFTSFDDVIDQEFQYGGTKGKLVGIVKDFHFESLHQEIVPMVFYGRRNNSFGTISVKIAAVDMQEGIAQIEKAWKEFLPTRPFGYNFISEYYRDLYQAETDQNQLLILFSILAIFIACLGLFGLATHSTLQRIKEIGIRKALGASVPSILKLLSKEIVILIVLANVIAWPLAWYFMNQWLNTFAYHISINVFIFLLAGVLAIGVALFTVSFQTLRAARTNPSNTLRTE